MSKLSVVLLASALVLPTSARADTLDGLALIYLYSKRCASLESLPLKTQEALRAGLSVAQNEIVDVATKWEEKLKPTGSGMCGVIRQSFPSLLD